VSALTAVTSAAAAVALATAEQEPDPTSISPGLVGFLATFGVVLASVLVFISMSHRLRGVQHRAQQDEADAAAGATLDRTTGEPGGLPAPDENGHHDAQQRAAESSLEDPGPVSDDPGTADGDDLRR
jgi:hypothetical protein